MKGLLCISLLAATGLAQAQTGAGLPMSAPPTDDSLTWKGLTLYGIVDVGIQNQTHAAARKSFKRTAITR